MPAIWWRRDLIWWTEWLCIYELREVVCFCNARILILKIFQHPLPLNPIQVRPGWGKYRTLQRVFQPACQALSERNQETFLLQTDGQILKPVQCAVCRTDIYFVSDIKVSVNFMSDMWLKLFLCFSRVRRFQQRTSCCNYNYKLQIFYFYF